MKSKMTQSFFKKERLLYMMSASLLFSTSVFSFSTTPVSKGFKSSINEAYSTPVSTNNSTSDSHFTKQNKQKHEVNGTLTDPSGVPLPGANILE